MTAAPKPTEERRGAPCSWGDAERAAVPCKHGRRFRCQSCGTGERDSIHTTRDGRGCVARLQQKEASKP